MRRNQSCVNHICEQQKASFVSCPPRTILSFLKGVKVHVLANISQHLLEILSYLCPKITELKYSIVSLQDKGMATESIVNLQSVNFTLRNRKSILKANVWSIIRERFCLLKRLVFKLV